MSSNETIFEAAAAGDIEFIQKNIKQLNEKNERGWTPLHFAARFGQKAVAQLLKENGADLTMVNGEGKTAAQVAAFWGNDAIAQLLTIATSTSATISVAGSPYPDNYTAVFAGNPLNR
jgi:NAD+ diphosphatase